MHQVWKVNCWDQAKYGNVQSWLKCSQIENNGYTKIQIAAAILETEVLFFCHNFF